MSFSEQARGLVEITRPGNAIVAGILTFIGGFVVQGSDITASGISITIAVVVTILTTAGGNTVNDYFDREIDRLNNPERPIPRGAITPRTALLFGSILFATAAGLALLLPLAAILIAIVNLVALVTYTEFFKGLPGVGNALVAYLGGSTFLFGAAAVNQLSSPAIILFLLASFSTVSREIIKDVEDVDGDREEGLNTLPIAIGERPSLLLAMGILVLMVGVSPVPYLLGTFGILYLVFVAPAVVLALYAGVLSFSDPARGQSLLKYGMFIAAAAFVGGQLTA
ncbi:geranylgeranylglycerol-phosphate geranylgeranyltransferase [Saliphagus sp. LR7]|uniref:geranylgeranylglycerol-phosphate geranylgeranyltransferase n=1 Tax=Saliphagus sp. LR7 TaxID=2282654 RepID=UPI000DF7BE90|nr:geranylgeranylglycerol-phosphate geranylgeranyltransferase [Saliphagus sp. LR7]